MLARLLAALAVLGLSVVVAEGLRALPPGLASLGLVTIGALAAPLIASHPSPLAISLGALGALSYAALRPSMPIAAAAVLVALVFAVRALSARRITAIVIQIALASLGGALACWVLLTFGSLPMPYGGIAGLVGFLLIATPFALGVEDPRAQVLIDLARRARGVSRMRLLRAAALRRRVAGAPWPLRVQDQQRIERALRSIVRLGEARADAGAIDIAAIDRALAGHVRALARFLRAHRARWASDQALIAQESPDLGADTERVEAEAAALDALS